MTGGQPAGQLDVFGGGDFVFEGGEALDVQVEEVNDGFVRKVGDEGANAGRAFKLQAGMRDGFLQLREPIAAVGVEHRRSADVRQFLAERWGESVFGREQEGLRGSEGV